MAEKVEEIAELIEGLKQENEINAEDFTKLLTDIKGKIEEIRDDKTGFDTASDEIKQLLNSRFRSVTDKFEELGFVLERMTDLINSATDNSAIADELKVLSDNFKSGFESVVNYANNDADAKNLLLDRLTSLENAVNNDAMIEVLKHRTDELVKGYENFVSDANLRHGNMVSAIADLRNTIEDYSSKTAFLCNSVESSIDSNSQKISDLESSVSSNLSNVNSKLYSIGDDLQKTINDSFEHLKYLSSNLSEYMNSNSLEVKTILECLRANVSEYSEHIKEEFDAFNSDITQKIADSYNMQSADTTSVLQNIKGLEDIIGQKSNEFETSVSDKFDNILEYVNTFKEAVLALKEDNESFLGAKLTELGTALQSAMSDYQQLLSDARAEVKTTASAICETTEKLVAQFSNDNIGEINSVKEELSAIASSNLADISEKIEKVTQNITEFTTLTAGNLSDYLASIKELFIDFSNKIEASQNKDEIIRKISDLEILMNNSDQSRTANFEHLTSLINGYKNALEAFIEDAGKSEAVYLKSLEDLKMAVENSDNSTLIENLEILINEKSNDKDDKLLSITDILNAYREKLDTLTENLEIINTANNSGISEIKQIIQESFDKEDFTAGIEKLANEKQSAITLKFNEIEEILNDYKTLIDNLAGTIKSQQDNYEGNFAELKNFIENSSGKDEIVEKIQEYIDEKNTGNDLKFDDISALIEEYNNSVTGYNNFVRTQNDDILMSLEDLKSLITQSSNLDEIAQRIEFFISENDKKNEKTLDDLRDLVSEYKNSVEKLAGDIQAQSVSTLSEIEELKTFAYDVLPRQTSLDILSELVNSKTLEYKTSLSDEIAGVKSSIQNIIENIKSALPASDNYEIINKINGLDLQLSDTAQNYEQALAVLGSKLGEYVEVSEKIASDTNSKLDLSISEFEGIRSKFEELSQKLTTLVGDSGLIEILANIRQQFNVVLEEINNEKEGLKSDTANLVNNGVENISSNLYLIGQNLEEVRIKQGEDHDDVILKLEDNISVMKSELQTFSDDIGEILDSKIDQMTQDLEPVKRAVHSFLEFDYNGAVSAIKEQIEISYINLLAEINSLKDDNPLMEKIELSYKESVEKLSGLENYVKEYVGSNLNSINEVLTNISDIVNKPEGSGLLDTDIAKLEAKIKENQDYVKASFAQALEQIKDIVNHRQSTELDEFRNSLLLLFSNDELMELIRELNKGLADSIEELGKNSNSSSSNILEVVNSIKNTVDSTLETVREKFGGTDSSSGDIKQSVDALNAKLDVIAMTSDSSEILDTVNDLNDTLQNVNEVYKEGLQKIAEKIDNISGSGIAGSGSDIKNSEETLSKLESIVNSIENKLDVIAMSDTAENTESDLQDLKETLDTLNESINSNNSYIDIVRGIDNKLDIIVQTQGDEFSADIEDIKDSIGSIETLIKSSTNLADLISTVDKKLDVIEQTQSDEFSADIEDLKGNIGNIEALIKSNANLADLISTVDKKLDVIVQTQGDEFSADIEDIKEDLSFLKHNIHPDSNISELINTINNKFDIITQNNPSDIADSISGKIDANYEEIKSDVSCIQDNISSLQEKSEEIKSVLSDVEKYSAETNSAINELGSKTDEISGTLETIHSVSTGLENKIDGLSSETRVISEKLENIQSESVSGIKLEDLINTLHNKVDILAMSEDNDVQEEISEIKELIEEQLSIIKSSDKNSSVDESLRKLLDEINRIDANISGIDFSQKTKEIKESIITAVVSAANEISFVEETEEIKDFVNERTNELHRTLMDVKHQLSAITNNGDDMDLYSYTLQDVESDLAKLRLGLNDLASKSSVNEICVISNNINKMAKAMDDLRQAVVETEIKRAESENMNEHILSISSRVNQLLLSQKEVDKAILEKLEDNSSAIKLLDNTPITSSIEKVLVAMDEKLSYSANLNTVLKNVMMYLGEWMDGTTETLTGIYDKTSKASNIKDIIKELRSELPQNNNLIDRLEQRFNEQEIRLDRLEKQLDRMNNILASKSDSDTLDRIDKIDEKLTRLSVNIEKLASYVE